MEQAIISQILISILGAVAGYLAKKVRERGDELKRREEESALIRKAQQMLLLRALRQDGDKYISQGWCTLLQKQDFDRIFHLYHQMGENGVTGPLHDDVMELPNNPAECCKFCIKEDKTNA